MKLRAKLLLAQLPLGLALAFVGVAAVLTASTLGERSQRILTENYRSVLAAQRMKEAIERIDSAALFLVAGERTKGVEQAGVYRQAFEAELAVEEKNITEPGEGEAATRLGALWREYGAELDAFTRATDPAKSAATYFGSLEPRFLAVKRAADEILALNQDAMVRKSDLAKRVSAQMIDLMIVVAIVALLVGIVASVGLTRRLLRPLTSLSQAARLIGEGDLEARATIVGRDELAELGSEFNDMAARLGLYRKSSLGELLAAQQASQAAIDSLPDPVVVFGVDGEILSLNHAGEALLSPGRPSSNATALSGAEPTVRAAIERVRDHVLQGRGPFLPEGFEDAVRVPSTEGERYLLPRGAPLYAAHGSVTGVTIILQDVTKPRRFDELKNDLVATVAHEFRTPLTSLHMAIHLILEGATGEVSERQQDLLAAARQDCERLQRIVEDILDLARLQAGKSELRRRPEAPVNLLESAVALERAAAKSRGVALAIEALPDLSQVSVDPERLQVVFANLMGNALRHTSEGGSITVRAKPGAGSVRFEVADTGSGVPLAYQKRVFERFFRVPGTQGSGSGLGLAVAKEIVEGHGGAIGVESDGEHGSVFWFTIPAA